MRQLIEGAMQVHGSLQEVVFLQENTNCLLVFRDGTALPTSHDGRGSERFEAIAHEVHTYSYLNSIAEELGGQDPLSLLAFGYSGTGPTNFAELLDAAGFQRSDVEDIAPPVRLLRDGSRVLGTVSNGHVKWQDGSVTRLPNPPARQTARKKRWWQFWK